MSITSIVIILCLNLLDTATDLDFPQSETIFLPALSLGGPVRMLQLPFWMTKDSPWNMLCSFPTGLESVSTI